MDRKKIQDQMRNGFYELAPDIFDQIKNAPLPDCLVLEEETKTTKNIVGKRCPLLLQLL